MKVYRDPKTFNPITIVLETEQEANMIYDVLNISSYQFSSYIKAVSRWETLDEFSKLKTIMWNQFETIFHPNKTGGGQ